MTTAPPLFDRSLVWFRRDLRCFDHAALYAALKHSQSVYCVFVFDKSLLQDLAPHDRRVWFIHASIRELARELTKLGGQLIVRYGIAEDEIPALAVELKVSAVFANHDYEPQAIRRDANVQNRLASFGCALHTRKDQVIFEKDEVLSLAGTPFSVFTPYKNAWLKKFYADGSDFFSKPYPVDTYANRFASDLPDALRSIPSLKDMGFSDAPTSQMNLPTGMSGGAILLEDFLQRIQRYDHARDFPSVKGPSYLSVHLRFGTVSVRHLVREAMACMRTAADQAGAQVWLAELIWRDFYFQILHHHPHVAERSFKPAYDAIQWEQGAHAERLFAAWCEARTGYPLVDAAMMQLNQTGYMHNRLRMVAACFLIKDLGIDWRWGERYFARHLNDFDLSANNGGWQWASSSGCDAQPYFRIFNPITQSEKFDAEGKFIRHYLPQLGKLTNKQIHAPWQHHSDVLRSAGLTLGKDYPLPIVEHEQARTATLARYAVVKKAGEKNAP
ncbi:DNA photolyase family protein [Undibacterium sp. Jales W-56]|uniref:cryptochrome/photolyase family protein n=1 Tax=Undibacterium sp. Jales W-56 TaxID=2897325 RepID=UPI0021D0C6E0|nr:deoxyribodipyrimidine photo-lyase [Undibacterium sp. Jales W-56]MCU6434707.1 DNA photolyase family protein [Undibacterium sp. Jales W-56]